MSTVALRKALEDLHRRIKDSTDKALADEALALAWEELGAIEAAAMMCDPDGEGPDGNTMETLEAIRQQVRARAEAE